MTAKTWKICPKVASGSDFFAQIATDIPSTTYDGREIYMQIQNVNRMQSRSPIICEMLESNRQTRLLGLTKHVDVTKF